VPPVLTPSVMTASSSAWSMIGTWLPSSTRSFCGLPVPVGEDEEVPGPEITCGTPMPAVKYGG